MADFDEGVEGLVDYAEDGEDLTPIRRALSLTPEERLIEMQNCVRSLETIRRLSAGI